MVRNNIAVYWDFENVHISLCSLLNGENWYRKNMFTKQPDLIKIEKIMEFISGLGSVNINRAYANWSFFYAYSAALHNYSIDLIQLFPRGPHGKNGADIRIAVDILEDCLRHFHLNTIVLISGDSDYISIAQKVRRMGKKIIGIGVEETTNQFWIRSCNEFKFYSSIVPIEESALSPIVPSEDELDLDEAKALLKKALLELFLKTGKNHMLRPAVKQAMTRLDPSFDEAHYGFSSFTEFLTQCNDIIELRKGPKDLIIALKEPGSEEPATSIPIDDREEGPISDLHPYDRILRKQQIRLVNPEILAHSFPAIVELFKEETTFSSYSDFISRLREKLAGSDIQISHPEGLRIKNLLYKAYCFRINPNQISLSETIKTETDLRSRIYRMIIKRILDNVGLDQEVDVLYFSRILFGNEEHQQEVHELIRSYRAKRVT